MVLKINKTPGNHFNRIRRSQYGMEKFQVITASYRSRSNKMTLNFILTDENLCSLCKKVSYDLSGLKSNNLLWTKYIIEHKNIRLMPE